MTLANTLCQNTLNTIIDRFGLTEQGQPHMNLLSPMSPAPVGQVRLFSGGPIHKMVYIGLTAPPIGLDSHMMFAFTAPDSPIPHFTLDSVKAGPHFAFHLDLIPRVDLGANLAYINETLQPLTEHFEAAKEIEGLTPAHLSPRQYAIMSPWMLANRATEEAFGNIKNAVNNYLTHWFGLVENGLSDGVMAELTDVDLAKRDRRNRNALFNPDVDPVWSQVTRMVGAEVSEQMRELLRTQAMP